MKKLLRAAAVADLVAKPVMERTCKGRPYQQIVDKLEDDVHYYTVFRCAAPS
jgi:hypothetical protein